jgi:hypothetical protein
MVAEVCTANREESWNRSAFDSTESGVVFY